MRLKHQLHAQWPLATSATLVRCQTTSHLAPPSFLSQAAFRLSNRPLLLQLPTRLVAEIPLLFRSFADRVPQDTT